MSNSKFLAKVVTAALLSGAAFNSTAWWNCTDTYCEVIGYPDPYDVDCPYVWGCDGNYDPPDDYGGNDGGGGNDGSTTPAVCLELMNVGLPSGCTRELAYSGTPRELLASYLQFDPIMELKPDIRSMIHTATHQLQICYADVSYTPDACENNFLYHIYAARIHAGQEHYEQAGYAVNGLTYVVNMAREERWLTSWLDYFSAGATYMGISVSIPLSHSAQFVKFNNMLAASRAQKVCYYWMSAWEGSGCS